MFVPVNLQDCNNPPYLMTVDALGLPTTWGKYQSSRCNGKGSKRVCKDAQVCPIAHQMVFDRTVLSALHAHLEKHGGFLKKSSPPSPGGVKWWEVILLAMPAWHTSPFSEYVLCPSPCLARSQQLELTLAQSVFVDQVLNVLFVCLVALFKYRGFVQP